MATASRGDEYSDEWDINWATGSSGQEALWEEEYCSNLIMNFREAKDESLPPAVLRGKVVFEALSLACIVTSDKLLYLSELQLPHLPHRVVVKIK